MAHVTCWLSTVCFSFSFCTRILMMLIRKPRFTCKIKERTQRHYKLKLVWHTQELYDGVYLQDEGVPLCLYIACRKYGYGTTNVLS